MPALMWVAFWSWMMGSAACWNDQVVLARVQKNSNRRDHPAV